MKISKQLYKKGSYWFKRFVDYYRKNNLILEKHASYPYVQVYYNHPKYKILLAEVELYMNEYNYRKNMQYDLLYSSKLFYDQVEEKGQIDVAKSSEKDIKGYRAHIHKLDRRLYLLKNNQEFLSTSLQKD